MFKKQIKKAFPLPENLFPLTRMPLDGKIKLAVAGVSQTKRKNGFHQKISFSKQECYFSKTGSSGFHKQKKNL